MSTICAGVVIYAKDLKRVADFYHNVVGLTTAQIVDKFTTSESTAFQLVVLQIPERLANMVSIDTPPVRRENAAIKPIYFVESLANAREAAVKFGEP